MNDAKLCNSDPNSILIFECFDWDSDGSHDFIGKTSFSIKELTDKMNMGFPLINPKKQVKSKYEHSGQLFCRGIKKEEHEVRTYSKSIHFYV